MSRQVHSPDYVGEDRRASSGWHLNKNVSITQIIGLVSAIIVSAMAWQNLNNRVGYVLPKKRFPAGLFSVSSRIEKLF